MNIRDLFEANRDVTDPRQLSVRSPYTMRFASATDSSSFRRRTVSSPAD